MNKLTRVEIISNKNGRMQMYNTKEYFNGKLKTIKYCLQDDDKTLKIFIEE